MIRTAGRLRWPVLAALAVAVVAVPGRADTPTKPDTKPDTKQQIDDLEKQIAEMKKKLDEMKKAQATPTAASVTQPVGTIPAAAIEQFKWRSIGPANMGGRVTALAVYEADPSIYYVATGGGGLLKTSNNGTTFAHQFDSQTTVAIGDVAVCQTNPDLVWVGTGEANPRNSVSYGDGVYKSTDGGKTWANMGLKKSFQIGKILIHPKNPDTVYVGALGRLYGPNEERGLFKTTDGGKTWAKVLYVDDKTGIIDARLDPNDPETLIVGAWERKRDEFDGFFGEAPVPDSYGPIVTHGAGGGMHKSSDGGKTWKKLTNGLPTVKTGRIGLDYSRKTKGLIYAIIDTEKVGTGEPLRQVYLGIVGDTNEGGGAKLQEITEGGPAQKAGLKADDIVVKIGDKKIENYESLLDIIRAGKAGDKLKFVVKRAGKDTEIEVTLANRPEAETPTRGAGGQGGGGQGGGGGRRAQAQTTARPVIGITFGTGTAVASVAAGGGAEKAGIKVGDVVLSVDGKAVKSQDEYRNAVGDERKAGDVVKLVVQRGDKEEKVDVTLAAAAPTAQGGRLMPGFAPELNFQATEVKVGTVAAGGAAEKAGIKVGDVVLEIDGKKVENFRDFLTALRTGQNEDNPRKVGDTVKVKVKQADKTIDATLALAEMQIPGMAGGPTRGANTRTPYGLGLGGQQANMQDRQGKDSFQTGGVYMSADNGETWKRVNSLNPRPMYFSVVRVDPTDDKIIYVLCDTPTPMYRSTDGGKSFSVLQTAGGVHADAHALWVSPHNGGKQLIIGCDGGWYTTFDKGATWEHLNHFALGQFYHLAVDNRKPYRVYGGLQDNGSWGGPSNTRRGYGQVNEDWLYVSGGDGFVCRVDPTDPDLIYSESQGGAIGRRNLRTGERGSIRATAGQNAAPYRFNWNTPFILSSANPSIFYSAGEFVFKSIKKGADQKKISPEITRTKAGSATALSESPVNADVLWAGTDDGFVWVTKDGGQNWTNVTENIKAAGLPGYRCIATLEASREKEGRCYVAIDAHRSDDDKPYLFVTEDHGKTWKPIANNLPAFGSTRCLREDITNGSMLYCGTEFGAWVSANRGASWSKLGTGLPTVACHEFAQPTTAGDLVVATHGRSVWVVDITSLRQMNADVLAAKATLFAPGTATRWRNPDGAESPYSRTDKRFVGTNPPAGTSLDYFLAKPAEKVSLKILDVAGKTVAEAGSPTKTAGFHRVPWTLTRGTIAVARTGGPGGGGGRFGGGGGGIPAGAYRLVLAVDGTEFSQSLAIELDPNAPKDLIALEEEEAQIEPPNPLKPKRIPAWIDN